LVGRRDFDVDRFLARPLTARLATARPAVRPVWYLWEDDRFWILIGPWNRILSDVTADGNVASTVDTCDLATGECLQVIVRGHGEVVAFDTSAAPGCSNGIWAQTTLPGIRAFGTI
jgi:hypothetical protein